MEERVKTSFIPKASLEVERKQSPKGNPVALANVIAGILLILAILGSGGVFLFKQLTVQAIAEKRAFLERSRAAFEPATIKELSRLDMRIKTGEALLNEHVALSKLFDELEALVLTSVRFSDFSYTPTGSGKIMLNAKGEAQSFNAVALQSGELSKSDIITDPIFSNVNIGTNGSIQFDFEASIDPSQLKYSSVRPQGTDSPAGSQTSTSENDSEQ